MEGAAFHVGSSDSPCPTATGYLDSKNTIVGKPMFDSNALFGNFRELCKVAETLHKALEAVSSREP